MDGPGLGRLEMRVGILVVAGLVMTVVMILLSDRITFRGQYRITVYLDDASGLNVGSPVKRDGLTIGEIERIDSYKDPQGRGSIRCIASIEADQEIDAAATLVRKTEGIFGDAQLSFSNPIMPSGTTLPTDGSAEIVASGTFLDSATAKLEDIVDGVAELLGPANRQDIRRTLVGVGDLVDESTALVRDLRGRSEQLGSLATKVEGMLDELRRDTAGLGSRTATSLEELALTLRELRAQTGRLTSTVEGLASTADRTLTRAEGLIGHTDELLVERRADLDSLVADLRGFAADLRAISGDIRSGRGLIGQLLGNSSWARDVDEVLVTGSQLVERVAANPTLLVWGTNAKEGDAARDHREREKLRRAFFEGFERNPPLRLAPPPEAAVTGNDAP